MSVCICLHPNFAEIKMPGYSLLVGEGRHALLPCWLPHHDLGGVCGGLQTAQRHVPLSQPTRCGSQWESRVGRGPQAWRRRDHYFLPAIALIGCKLSRCKSNEKSADSQSPMDELFTLFFFRCCMHCSSAMFWVPAKSLLSGAAPSRSDHSALTTHHTSMAINTQRASGASWEPELGILPRKLNFSIWASKKSWVDPLWLDSSECPILTNS